MTRLLTIAVALTFGAAPAFAYEPISNQASNLVPRDTRSDIAPALPAPNLGADAGPSGYLRAAQQSLTDRQTGKAQQGLEMAETRLLDRSVPQVDGAAPDTARPVEAIRTALRDLGHNNLAAAQQHTREALQAIS